MLHKKISSSIILLLQFFVFTTAKAGSGTDSKDFSMVPIEGLLEEEDVGKSLTPTLRVGEELVQFRTNPEKKRANTKISASSCHFYANQVKDNGQFVNGLDKNVSVALQSAYQENCQRAVIHVYHAVIDGYTKGNFRGANIRDDLLDDAGEIEVSPQNISEVIEFRKSLGDHYVKTVYSGFLAVMRVEFSFESREDISNMSAIFAESGSDLILANQNESSQSLGDRGTHADNRESANRRASIAVSRQMARKKINGSWTIKTYVKGSLDNNDDNSFPFIQTDMSALAGNYTTLINQMNRFNSWVSKLNNASVSDSAPILVDIGAIRDSRALFHRPIPGLTFDGDNISLSSLEIETSKIFRAIVAAKTSFNSAVNSPKRKNKEQKLLNMLQDSSSHIEYLVQNSIPVDEVTGSTILHWAAVYDLPELVGMIIEMDPRGTIIDARDYLGRTPLMRASANGNYKVAQILIDSSASIDYVDSNGNSALTYATMTSNTGTKQVACVGAAMVGGAIFPPLALIGVAGEAVVNGQRIVCPDHLCEHVFDCGHKRIAKLLIERGADQSLKANWSELNTVSNALTAPWRTIHRGIRYAGKLGKVDDERN